MTNGLEKAKKLTEMDVLRAVKRAISPWSNYIGDQVQREHAIRIRAGGIGHAPRVGLISRRLNALAASGHLVKSQSTQGYYGYHWTITPLGIARLQSLDTGGGEA